MRITYTAPNRPYDYPYVSALNAIGHLHAFVSGFTRLSPRSAISQIGPKLHRHDFLQTLYLLSLKLNLPLKSQSFIQRMSNSRLDSASLKWAEKSDVFIFHRTQGFSTTNYLKKHNSSTLCVMQEVNTHVETAHQLMYEEFSSLGLKHQFEGYEDYELRLKTYDIADQILCPSEFVKKSFLDRGFSSDKLIKINFGFPSIVNLHHRHVKRDSFRLLFVGQINYRKGLRYAIEAFRKLKHPKKEFVIVGPMTKITGLENTNIPEGVKFLGIRKGLALQEEFRSADIFILPSIEEGLALVQGEALSFGLPILITTNTGGEDLIQDGKEGFVVPPRNIDVLSDRLQQMADDRIMLEDMSGHARNAATSLGGWDKAAERLVSVLEQLILHRNI